MASEPRLELQRLGRRLLLPAALAVLAFLGLALVADLEELVAALEGFPLPLLLPVLLLSLVNYALRFGRWQLYLRKLELRLPLHRSLGVFLVGFVLSVTPGKSGELGKAWLVKRLGGGPARRAVSAVLAERVTDLMGVSLLAVMAAASFSWGLWLVVAGVAGWTLALALLAWRQAGDWALGALTRLPLVHRMVPHLAEVLERLRLLLGPSLLAAGLLLAAVAWGAEGLGFALVAGHYRPDYPWLTGIFDYNLGTLLGGLSMLPGGLLATEGSLTALVRSHGLATAQAASVTLIVRGATLWFAVLLGLAALPRVVAWIHRAELSSSGPQGRGGG